MLHAYQLTKTVHHYTVSLLQTVWYLAANSYLIAIVSGC